MTSYSQTITGGVTPAAARPRSGSTRSQRGSVYSTAGRTPSRALKLYTAGDSWAAWAMHPGSTVASAPFPFWSGTVFYDCPYGQAASGTFGLTLNGDGSINWNGLSKEGFTTDGMLRDKLASHLVPKSTSSWGYQGAHPGTTAQAWAGDITTYDPGPSHHFAPSAGRWNGLIQALHADTGDAVLFLTLGGNDVLYGGHSRDVDTGGWSTFIATTVSDAVRATVDYIVAAKPDIEVVICSYVPFYVRGSVSDAPDNGGTGTPYHYPPHGNTESTATCAWLTDTFGFYATWQTDSSAEIVRYATQQATAGLPFGPLFYSANYNYWISSQNNALAQDILTGSYAMNGVNPVYWTNATARITQTKANTVMRMLTGCWTAAAADHPSNVIYCDVWDDLPKDPQQVSAGIASAYISPPRRMWIEGVHLNPQGYSLWLDAVLARWLPASRFDVTDKAQANVGVPTVGSVTPVAARARAGVGKPVAGSVTPTAARAVAALTKATVATFNPLGVLSQFIEFLIPAFVSPSGPSPRKQVAVSAVAAVGPVGYPRPNKLTVAATVGIVGSLTVSGVRRLVQSRVSRRPE